MNCLFVEQSNWGRKLNLSDDGYEKVNFANSFKFCFYGKEYSGTYVNANGNITFNQGDGDFSPDFHEFINDANPRIAPYWIDLDPRFPGTNGGIFVNELPHAFVVTWAELPYYYGANYPRINTLQLVLCKNGLIGMSYGTLDNKFPASDAAPSYPLIGIAAGSGGDSDIFRYDAALNQDPRETVVGPIGALNNSQLFFYPTEKGYKLLDRMVSFELEVVIPCGYELDVTRQPIGALNNGCSGDICCKVVDFPLHNLCDKGNDHCDCTKGVWADGWIEINVAIPMVEKINKVPTYTCTVGNIIIDKLIAIECLNKLWDACCSQVIKEMTLEQIVVSPKGHPDACHEMTYKLKGAAKLNICAKLNECQ